MTMVLSVRASMLVLAIGLAGIVAPEMSRAALPAFEVHEKSILELQAAQTSGKVTARDLVDAYIARIEAYDQAGPKLNAIVTLNPHARQEAEALDRERASKGARGPLHGIPVLVKDNFDAVGMPTTGGSLGFAGLMPEADAFQVKRLRNAGAIILGKTTMHELAAGISTHSSLTGITRNPYDPSRLPGGSSGGTGAAVAASFAAAGLGTDTSGSIQIPSSFQNLVGLRPTRGLSSRAGVMPMSSSQDVAGPMARSVTDLAILLDATAGFDPDDASTAVVRGRQQVSYQNALQPGGLKGARIGVDRSLFGSGAEAKEIADRVLAALDAMKAQGAELIDVTIPELTARLDKSEVTEYEFKFDLADYLQGHQGAPVRSLGEILDRGLYSEAMERQLRSWNKPLTRDTPQYHEALSIRADLRSRVLETFRTQRLDALAYPAPLRKPAPVGTSQGGWGPDSVISAATGLPQIAIPAGLSADGLPIGLALLGKEFAEPTLLKLAYAWEQSARPRRAPFSTPPLVNGRAPAPLEFVTAVESPGDVGPSARARFSYDSTTAVLAYEVQVMNLGDDDVVGLTLQKGEPQLPGPVVAHLLFPRQQTASSTLLLSPARREDLMGGRLFLHFYTRKASLGVGRSVLRVPGAGAF